MGFYLPATEYDNLHAILNLIVNFEAKFINFNISPFKNSPCALNLDSSSDFCFEPSFHPGFFLACPTRLC